VLLINAMFIFPSNTADEEGFYLFVSSWLLCLLVICNSNSNIYLSDRAYLNTVAFAKVGNFLFHAVGIVCVCIVLVLQC
jgi:hypothetical protein